MWLFVSMFFFIFKDETFYLKFANNLLLLTISNAIIQNHQRMYLNILRDLLEDVCKFRKHILKCNLTINRLKLLFWCTHIFRMHVVNNAKLGWYRNFKLMTCIIWKFEVICKYLAGIELLFLRLRSFVSAKDSRTI